MAYNYGYPQNPYMGYPMQQGQQSQQAQPVMPQVQSQPAPTSGYICRAVASREEALAVPSDIMGTSLIMPDIAHGMIYMKRFNPQTGASDFADFTFTAPQKNEVAGDYAPRADFEALKNAFLEMRAEIDKLKTPVKSKKED